MVAMVFIIFCKLIDTKLFIHLNFKPRMYIQTEEVAFFTLFSLYFPLTILYFLWIFFTIKTKRNIFTLIVSDNSIRIKYRSMNLRLKIWPETKLRICSSYYCSVPAI